MLGLGVSMYDTTTGSYIANYQGYFESMASNVCNQTATWNQVTAVQEQPHWSVYLTTGTTYVLESWLYTDCEVIVNNAYAAGDAQCNVGSPGLHLATLSSIDIN